jgi:hypothetical protein
VAEDATYRLNDLDDEVAPTCNLGAFGGGCDEDVLRRDSGRRARRAGSFIVIVVRKWSWEIWR